MAVKTYVYGLARLVQQACKYIRRYETRLRANLSIGDGGTQREAALDAVLTACDALDGLLRVYEKN